MSKTKNTFGRDQKMRFSISKIFIFIQFWVKIFKNFLNFRFFFTRNCTKMKIFEIEIFRFFVISTKNISFFVFDINKIVRYFFMELLNFFYEKSFFTREEHAEHKIRSIYRPPECWIFFLWFMIPITRDWWSWPCVAKIKMTFHSRFFLRLRWCQEVIEKSTSDPESNLNRFGHVSHEKTNVFPELGSYFRQRHHVGSLR